MARMRSVKPEFWTDPDIADLSRDARLLYIGLWNLSDEWGRLRGDGRYLKGQLFAYDDDLTAADIQRLVDELDKAGKVVKYEHDGRPYLFLPTLAKHQRLEPDRVPSRLPAPPSADMSTPGDVSSEPRANESDTSTNDLALSRQHVAGSMKQAAGKARATRAPTAAADRLAEAARLIAAACAIADADAFAVAETISRERRPRNLPGLVRTLIDTGDIGAFLADAQARAPCGRHNRWPCSQCRSEQIGRDP